MKFSCYTTLYDRKGEDNMRVAFLGKYPLNLDKMSGGLVNMNYNLVEGLRKLNNLELHVITCESQVKQACTVFNKSARIHYLPGQKRFGNITLSIPDVHKLKTKIKEIKPDIIHSQDQDKYAHAALQTNYPAVVSICSIVSESYKFKKNPIDCLRKIANAYTEMHCLKRAKDIIIASPYLKSMISSKTKADLHYIPNPVKDDFFKLKSKEQKNRILSAARVIPLKGIHILLEAINLAKKKNPDIRLFIAGAVENVGYYNKLKNFVALCDLGKNVKFLGLLNESELMDEYAKCSVFVSASFSETFSIVTAQALAAGKPVIASRVGGIPSLITEGKTGFLVPSGDAQNLAEKIVMLLENDDLRKDLGKEGRKQAFRRFKIEIIARELHRVYQIVAERYSKQKALQK